jgi:hypothetical protein
MAPTLYPSVHDRSPSGGLSLVGYMMVLIAVIMLPMLCLVGIISWDYGHAARRTIEAERLDVANNIRIMIDREIEHTAGFLDGISDAPGLRNNTPQIVERVVATARARGFASLAVYGLDGHVMMTSSGPPPLPAEKLGLARIAEGQHHFVSGLIDTGEKPGLYFVSVPMHSDGKVVAMLTAGLPPAHLQGVLAEANVLRDGWTSSIVDRNGILLARGRDADVYVGMEAQKPMADAARGDAPAGLFDELNREGVSINNSFERSTTSGWVAGVGVRTSVVEAPLRHTALIMAVTGVGLTLVSLVLAFMVAGNLSRSIRRLGIAAAAIASGDAVRMPESNIAELRDVSHSMEVTGALARRDRGAK